MTNNTKNITNIDENLINEFQQNGAIVVRNLISQTELDNLAKAIERDIAKPGPFYHGYETKNEGTFHGNLRLWEHDLDFRALCLDSSLPKIAHRFLSGKRINLLYDQLFVKESSTTQRTRWHNDLPYWPIRGDKVVSIWIALDHVTKDSGALEFVRGSHRWDRFFQPETFGKTKAIDAYEINPNYEPMPDIESDRSQFDIISWDLQPGDAYVFHGMTVHGDAGNSTSNRRRRGYTIRYTGDDVVYDTRIGTNKTLRFEDLNDGDPIDSDRFPVVFAASKN